MLRVERLCPFRDYAFKERGRDVAYVTPHRILSYFFCSSSARVSFVSSSGLRCKDDVHYLRSGHGSRSLSRRWDGWWSADLCSVPMIEETVCVSGFCVFLLASFVLLCGGGFVCGYGLYFG